MTGSVVLRLDTGPTDADLVERARARDVQAMEMLFRRHVSMASGLAYRLLGRDGELDDVVQESFATALGSIARLERPQAFAAWLASIVTRTAIATIRRRRLLARLGIVKEEPIVLENLVSAAAPPDVASDLRTLYRIVDQLPTEERIVLLLRRVEQLSLDEISAHTGWSLATVKRKLGRADERLAAASNKGMP
jgi:RNA polymerase sigma-70 factor (ECF subfamily)